MELYFAPMEGIASPLFRRTHAACFPGADRYYAPFLAPDGSGPRAFWRVTYFIEFTDKTLHSISEAEIRQTRKRPRGIR